MRRYTTLRDINASLLPVILVFLKVVRSVSGVVGFSVITIANLQVSVPMKEFRN